MDGFSYQAVDADDDGAVGSGAFLHELPGQKTLKTAISCEGVGLHSGLPVNVRLLPGPAGQGIVFRRIDLGVSIPARYDHVVDTRLCTVLGREDARVGTVEHLMAALAAAGVDNATIEVDGQEMPVLDGSSEPWAFLLDCAGLAAQAAPRVVIQVLRTVRVEEGDASVELRPGVRPGTGGMHMALSIDFGAAAIGRQALSIAFDGTRDGTETFRRELARARTFTQKHEIDGLRRLGLAQGGSLANAVVVDGADVLNPAGLRMRDEFVRHKMLDAVGDLALAGGVLQGRFTGHKSGHALNNRALNALFADDANWCFAAPAGYGHGSGRLAA